ncbi:hypothetical protein N9V90_03185 [Endozoicomonas sp.]|nr:hypothetical protein [Endozoicomonas sp.]
MTPERYKKIRAVIDHHQPDLTVLADQVHKPHNIEAILRICDAIGISEIHVPHPTQDYRQAPHRSVGSDQWVNAKYHERIKDSADSLKERRFKLYASHFSGLPRNK